MSSKAPGSQATSGTGIFIREGKRAGNWEFSSASLSIGFHIEVSETLRRQLPVASAIVKAKCHERLDKAIAVIRRSEEHTSELQSLMRISYAVFCLKKTQ